jgi:hypothetical protein
MIEWTPAVQASLKPAKDSLLSLFRTTAENRWDADTILPYWMAAVGRPLGCRTRPTCFSGGRLTVEVDGAQWRQELFPLTGKILARLNKLLGEALVKAVDYRLARPQRRPPARALSAAGQVPSAAEPSAAIDEASGISDPQLRRLYRASMKKARQA